MKTFIPLISEKPLMVGDVVERQYLPEGTRFKLNRPSGKITRVATNNIKDDGRLLGLSDDGSAYTRQDTTCIIVSLPRQPAMINSGLYDAIKKLDNYRDSYVTTGQEIKMRKFVPTPISRHEAIAIANEIRERAEHERNEGLTVAKTKEIAESSSGPSLEQRIADCPRNIDAEIVMRSHRSRRQYDMDALNDPRIGDWYV